MDHNHPSSVGHAAPHVWPDVRLQPLECVAVDVESVGGLRRPPRWGGTRSALNEELDLVGTRSAGEDHHVAPTKAPPIAPGCIAVAAGKSARKHGPSGKVLNDRVTNLRPDYRLTAGSAASAESYT